MARLSALPPDNVMAAVASRLGAPPLLVQPVRRGGNNRVYRVNTSGGVFCLKIYPKSHEDSRDRLGVELQALRFLERHGVAAVPRVIGGDASLNFSILEWVSGDQIDHPGERETVAALDFAKRLLELRKEESALELPLASEACLSCRELVRQIQSRLQILQELPQESGLHEFLSGSLFPRLSSFLDSPAVDRHRRNGIFDRQLERSIQCLSPSDFGYHNALKTSRGLVFLDFEYFGWDDPVKLAADFILHPGQAIPLKEGIRFVTAWAQELGNDQDFQERFSLHYPLYVLRWCLILLNAFIPAKWELRREDAQADWAEVKHCQIGKARAMISRFDERIF